ncbi:hypothetical protein BCR33DRAFT_782640 [Rhizoclosmatium globosum]|uniref:Uncharacterized protein n=1 Tax=Rhizoclosmatium globosum TaxID=329046 RepID=A0A1Y2CML5_9FUNG|nr:hypothetical protein BCR33DRAFT_782640 [Rhizoclosmatium globosum]|eukprot:ORY48271.1 hypothetical protein BCR33DRAFT_782640 [Rhizoclosmatium globosum]
MQNTPTLLEVMKLLTQVATAQRQMQDQMALLQKQLTEVNAKTECTNKTLLRFETTQQSNERRIQSINTQLNWLRNQTATYHTRINSPLLERFHGVVSSKAFVIMNVKRFVASSDCSVTVSRKPTIIDLFSSLERMWKMNYEIQFGLSRHCSPVHDDGPNKQYTQTAK